MTSRLAIDGDRFVQDGVPCNGSRRLRGKPLDGRLLGIDLAGTREDDTIARVIEGAALAGANAVTFTISHPDGEPAFASDGTPDAASLRRAASILSRSSSAGLAPMVRVLGGSDPWRLARPDGIARAVGSVSAWVAAHDVPAAAILVDQATSRPSRPASRTPRGTRAGIDQLVAHVRVNGPPGILVGAGGPTGTSGADFRIRHVERHRHAVNRIRVDIEVREAAAPEIRLGSGDDLQWPDGSLDAAVAAGASWFLRMLPEHDAPARDERLDAFFETVRAARDWKVRPSDHPMVSLADQRAAFRRHADAIRALGLTPANAPAGAPR